MVYIVSKWTFLYMTLGTPGISGEKREQKMAEQFVTVGLRPKNPLSRKLFRLWPMVEDLLP